MQAKLTLVKKTEQEIADKKVSERLYLEALYDANNPEDNSFAKATPFAQLEMQIDNEVLFDRYKEGQKFKVTFEPID